MGLANYFFVGPGHFVRRCVTGLLLLSRLSSPLASSTTVVAALCCAATVPVLAAVETAKKSYNLPRGDASATLKQFASLSGQPIVYLIERVRGEQTNAIAGEFTPREALERMLAGTALTVAQDAATGAFVISRQRPVAPPAAKREANSAPQSEPVPPATMKRSLVARLGLALAALSGASAASAQPAVPAASEIIKLNAFEVSGSAPNRYQAADASSGGRVRTEIFNSPQTINVVTEALLKDVGSARILDALKYIPGVTEGTIPNGLDRITVRGFQTEAQLVDGFQDRWAANIDPVTIDRIEVVKGPNAILSPQGNPGGTINSATKKPLFVDPRSSVRVEYGAFDAGSVEFDSTGRVGNASTKLAYRLIVAARDYDNYWGNTFVRRHSISPSLSYQLNPATKIILQADFSKWKSSNYIGIPIDPSSGTNNKARLLSGVSRTVAVYGDDIFRFEKRHNVRLFVTSDLTEHLSVRVAARLSNTSQRNNQLNFGFIGGPGGAYDPNTGFWTPGIVYGPRPTFTPSPAPVPSRSYTAGGTNNELDEKRVNFQNDWVYARTFGDVKSTTGAGFAYNRAQPDGNAGESARTTAITHVPVNFDNPDRGPLTTGAVTNLSLIYNLDRQYYANQSLAAFDERLIVSAGASKFETRNWGRNFFGPSSQVGEKTTYNYGVVVKPIKLISLFFGHSENASPTTFNVPAPRGVPDFSVGSQDEFGARARLLDNRLQLGVTYFSITQNAFSVANPANLAVPAPVPPFPALFSDREAKGWELEATYEITKGFTIIGNYANFTNRDPNDQPFRSVAEKSAAAWARYEFQGSTLKGFHVSAGANWLDKRPGDSAGAATAASTPTRLIFTQPSFYLEARTLIDLAAGYTTGPWTLQANIDNVMDKEYLQASISRTFVYPGPGINFRGSVTYRF